MSFPIPGWRRFACWASDWTPGGRPWCFSEDGPLFKGFTAIFNEVFGKTTLVKADILRALSAGPATCTVLAEKLAAFPRKRNVTLRTALVYEGALDESVATGGAFDYIVPVEALLGEKDVI